MDRFILFAGLCLVAASVASAYNIVCYVNIDAQSRTAPWNFDPATHFSGAQCTHMVVAYADIGDSNNLIEQSAGDTTFYSSVTDLKNSNADLKVLLAVGGPGFDATKFSGVATDANKGTFSTNVISFLRTNQFDGLMLDWRFPETDEKDAFTALCQQLSDDFDSDTTSGDSLLLGAAVSGDPVLMNDIYDIPALDNHLDLINIMAYDFYNVAYGVVRHHAPLSPGILDTQDFAHWNAEDAMIFWRNRGATTEKLLMGVAAYGRTFTLSSQQFNDIGASASGTGDAGDYTNEAGLLSYFEICSGFPSTQMKWSDEHQVPYAFDGDQWVGYDDAASAELKATFVINYSFGGVAVWSLDLDDYLGQCSSQAYPIVHGLFTTLEADVSTITFTTAAETQTTCPSSDLYRGCVGQENGQYSVPGYPRCFYNCWDGIAFLQQCPLNLVFNEDCACCDHDDTNVPTGGTGADFCQNMDDGIYAKTDNPAQYNHCAHGVTYIRDCPQNTVYSTSCQCCDHAT